jgi:hypothetical protein
MKIIWVAAIALSVFSAEALSEERAPDRWSCDHGGSNEHAATQKWIIANGRMTGPSGKGGLRVILNNDRVLIGYLKVRDQSSADPFESFVVIEKKTGNYLDIDTLTMAVMGKSHDDVSQPTVDIGHCTLLGR